MWTLPCCCAACVSVCQSSTEDGKTDCVRLCMYMCVYMCTRTHREAGRPRVQICSGVLLPLSLDCQSHFVFPSHLLNPKGPLRALHISQKHAKAIQTKMPCKQTHGLFCLKCAADSESQSRCILKGMKRKLCFCLVTAIRLTLVLNVIFLFIFLLNRIVEHCVLPAWGLHTLC